MSNKGLKFGFTGPESSGKTTLSSELSKIYLGEWIPEYAREFLSKKKGKYTIHDLDKIAKKQIESINRESSKIQFFDTELLVIKIWSEFKYQKCSTTIMKAFKYQKIDHYFLCSPDIPYEKDPLREHPKQRFELFDIYLNNLKTYNLPFSIIEGSTNERVEKCSSIIDTYSR